MSTACLPFPESELQGFRLIRRALPLFRRLHDQAARRDRAGNRRLHFDEYLILELVFFLNPIVTSMRGLVLASALEGVQRRLEIPPTSLGSFSEAAGVFDPHALQAIVRELGRKLKPLPHDPRLDGLPGVLTAVDGTEISALAKLVGWAQHRRDLKLHVAFEPLAGVPVAANWTGSKDSEKANLRQRLEPGRIYVNDRGYVDYRLFQQIVDIGSWFVCRLRDDSVFTVLQDRPLPGRATAAGVLSDRIVWLGGRDGKRALRQPLRILTVACKPHRKRRHTGYGGPAQGDHLTLVTNLLDLPAEVIALIYRQRWTVEIFFRFFKHVLGCRHLLSHRPNGILIQVYLAIILCMLLALYTGRKVTLRTLEMLRWYFIGWATLEEVEAHIAQLKKVKA